MGAADGDDIQDTRHEMDMLDPSQIARLSNHPEADRELVFKEYATKWIAAHPKRFVELCGIRIAKSVLIDWDNPRAYLNPSYLASRIAILILTLVGLGVAWRDRWSLMLPAILAGTALASYTLTVAAARFAFPFEPIQLALGGAFLAMLLPDPDRPRGAVDRGFEPLMPTSRAHARTLNPRGLCMTSTTLEPPPLVFAMCVEAGGFEAMAVRAAQSLRKFGGRFANCKMYGVTPRMGPALNRQTLREFNALGVEHINIRPKNPYAWYPLMNKPLTLLEVQRRTDAEQICFLDSDMIVMSEPNLLQLDTDTGFIACAPDSGIGSAGDDDINTPFWREACKALGISYQDLPWVFAHREKVDIRLYFNSGIFTFRKAGPICRCISASRHAVARCKNIVAHLQHLHARTSFGGHRGGEREIEMETAAARIQLCRREKNCRLV